MKAVLLLVVALAACGGDDGARSDDVVVDAASDAPVDAGGSVDLTQPVHVDLAAAPPPLLSTWNLFAWDAATATYTWNPTGQRIQPYELNTALFSDYSLKQRAIYIPPGAAATYQADAAFELPVGSVIVKNFAFAEDLRQPEHNVTLIETRLLVRHEDGWHPLPYIWNADQTDAVYSPAGEVRAIAFTASDGAALTANYLIPQKNQCENCHARKESESSPATLVPIGIKARHLNRTGTSGANQLQEMVDHGLLVGLPATGVPTAYDFRPIETGGVAAIPPADVDAAARSYLDINCAHCHNPHGVQGVTSQLFLNHDETDAFHLGECKRPGSAAQGTGGFAFDIVPGDPDTSILYFRVHTTMVGAMMPLLGRSVTHDRGAELLHAWIAAMPENDCSGK